jgi:GNAT superfamily N-acetyltransferase
MPFSIRPATIADLFWLRVLYQQVIEEQAALYPVHDAQEFTHFTATIAARLGVDPNFHCYVAEDGPILVGFVMGEITFRPIGRPHRVGVCHWLYTIPARRGEGIGRALSLAIAQPAIQAGAEVIEVIAKPGDMQWIHRGWVPVSITHALPLSQAILASTPTTPPNGHTEMLHVREESDSTPEENL